MDNILTIFDKISPYLGMLTGFFGAFFVAKVEIGANIKIQKMQIESTSQLQEKRYENERIKVKEEFRIEQLKKILELMFFSTETALDYWKSRKNDDSYGDRTNFYANMKENQTHIKNIVLAFGNCIQLRILCAAEWNLKLNNIHSYLTANYILLSLIKFEITNEKVDAIQFYMMQTAPSIGDASLDGNDKIIKEELLFYKNLYQFPDWVISD